MHGGEMTASLYVYAPFAGLGGIIIALAIYFYIKAQPGGNEKMEDLAAQIHAGAMVFLKREYSILAVFLIVVAALLFWRVNPQTAAATLIEFFPRQFVESLVQELTQRLSAQGEAA